ncbi:hypothetical protein GCM10017781_24980 [Deinococcus metalli]|uniref:Uncharacterized protein n=1 Tax=Deinococcus metalli TaxID=1141878 RepID=A0ABQ3JN68_9DEIO|nr:hypothetical protein GCM10017781_24980 [Deinococcus metalli]
MADLEGHRAAAQRAPVHAVPDAARQPGLAAASVEILGARVGQEGQAKTEEPSSHGPSVVRSRQGAAPRPSKRPERSSASSKAPNGECTDAHRTAASMS